MNEAEFVARWESERRIYEAWSSLVRDRIIRGLRASAEIENLEYFLKIPVTPRLKATESLVDKAFYRGKNYTNPYEAITDKVGMRFVVLKTSDIRHVMEVIEGSPDWEHSKDRDYEEERRERPTEFTYQSVHYIVRAKKGIRAGRLRIPEGTPCEIQVRTLLQHAYSEIAHDSIYKPSRQAPPTVHRAIARSMALIEATDESFEQAYRYLNEAIEPERSALKALAEVYANATGSVPELERSSVLILEAFADQLKEGLVERVGALMSESPFLAERIRERATDQHLYRQAIMPFVYLQVKESPSKTKEVWPLTDAELEPIYTDMGKSYGAY